MTKKRILTYKLGRKKKTRTAKTRIPPKDGFQKDCSTSDLHQQVKTRTFSAKKKSAKGNRWQLKKKKKQKGVENLGCRD